MVETQVGPPVREFIFTGEGEAAGFTPTYLVHEQGPILRAVQVVTTVLDSQGQIQPQILDIAIDRPVSGKTIRKLSGELETLPPQAFAVRTEAFQSVTGYLFKLMLLPDDARRLIEVVKEAEQLEKPPRRRSPRRRIFRKKPKRERASPKEARAPSPIIAAHSIQGAAHLENQDAFALLQREVRGAIVADGVGGTKFGTPAKYGAWAAQQATIITKNQLIAGSSPLQALAVAHQYLDQTQHLIHAGERGQTGLTAVVVSTDWQVEGAYVSDVIAVNIRKSGGHKLLTRPDLLGFVRVDVPSNLKGTIHEIEMIKKNPTWGHMVTQSLGQKDPLGIHQLVPTQLHPGDILLVFTDGLWGKFTWEQIERIVRKNSPKRAVEILTGQEGGDDITVSIIERPLR